MTKNPDMMQAILLVQPEALCGDEGRKDAFCRRQEAKRLNILWLLAAGSDEDASLPGEFLADLLRDIDEPETV